MTRTTEELIEEYDFVRSGWFLRANGLKESAEVKQVSQDFADQFSELVEGLRAAQADLAARDSVIVSALSKHRRQCSCGICPALRQSPVDALDAVKAAVWEECLTEIEENELNTDQARKGNPYRNTPNVGAGA